MRKGLRLKKLEILGQTRIIADERTNSLLIFASKQDIATIRNPVDLTASAVDEDFIAAYDEMTNLPDYHAFLMLVLPYSTGVSVDIGAKVSNPSKKRVRPLVAYIPHMAKYQAFIEGFELNGVPVSDSIEGAVMMLDGMRRYQPCSIR